jgi:filamentous hemagglutinin family protein
LAAGGAIGQAHAAPAFSPAWFAAKAAIQNTAAATGLMPNGQPVSSLTPGQRQAQQASQQVQKSIADLSWAARLIVLQQAAQRTAIPPGNVPNGLGAGGLDPDFGDAWQNAGLDPQNPQSVDSNGHVVVDVKQTGSRAIANWNSFNIGQNTILNFDQSGGTQSNGANNWVILNRINNPGTAPSQVLGSITAQGAVYVIDHNGIVFGSGSQVNVHSLIASSLDFLNTNDDVVQTPADIAASNALFMNAVGGLAALEAGASGSAGQNNGAPNEVLGLGNNASVPSASQYQAPGDIQIQVGASITTHTNGSASDGGFILIAAPNVSNAGSITATNGQAILAAGIGVSVKPDVSNPQILLAELTGKVTADDQGGADITPVGTLTNLNTGIVQTPRGNIDLLGTNVFQNGVVGATTSVNTPGSITISTVDEYVANAPDGSAYSGQSLVSQQANGGGNDTHRAGQLIFGDNSLTTMQPDDDGETATSSPGTSFTPGSITMTAGSVWFQDSSLIEAPGANVSVAALTPSVAGDKTPPGDTAVQGRIYVDTGATIDVAGLADVQEAVADTLVTIGLIGQNDLADSPLLRNSFLMGLTNVVIDSTQSGTRADGTPWVGSPDLNAQGYVDLIPRSIDQLLTNGGAIELSGAQVITAQGSTLDLDGGFVHYLGGMIKTTVLVDQFGNNVPIGQADPNDIFVGVAGEYIDNHPRWGVSDIYQNPLIGRAAYEDDFIVGGNAGTLSIFASQTLVLDGAMSAQAVAGTKQITNNSQPTGGSFNLGDDPVAFNPGNALLSELSLGFGAGNAGETGTVILQDDAPQLSDLFAAGFSADTPLDTAAFNALSNTDPNNLLATRVVPTDALSEGGFANVSVTEAATTGMGVIVAAGSRLAVQPGGSITFNTPLAPVTVLGDLIAPSGTITIAAGGDIVVGPDAMLSVAGLWVNNDQPLAFGAVPGGSQYINGGSITLSTTDASSSGLDSSNTNGVDVTGSIDLQAGSIVDVSSGGEMQANGQMLMQNGLPEGLGGSLSLQTYLGSVENVFGGEHGSTLPATQPTAGRIEMDGTIESEGFAGGGTLTLQALGFQIGGDPSTAPSWDLVLPTDFFAQQGFGHYVLNAMYDATVAPDAQVLLTQQNLLPNIEALQQAASGADLASNGLTTGGAVDPYYRQPTDLVMTAGDYLSWQVSATDPTHPTYTGVSGAVTVGEGAAIIGDAGAHIGLGSPAQVTVLGSLIAPGGSITLSADSNVGSPGLQSGQVTQTGGFTSDGKSVWLGADALLDVSGVVLSDPFGPFVRNGFNLFQASIGKVLPGGSVIISDDSGYVVAQAGARIDVSGAAATFDELQAGGGYAPQLVWSDAGSILLGAASGLMVDATLVGQAGAAQGEGGTLTILPEQVVTSVLLPGSTTPITSGATGLILQQSGDLASASLTPGQSLGDNDVGMLQFAVDRLAGSGIATFVVSDSAQGSAPTSVPVAFAGDVDLSMSDAVILHTGQIVALPAGSTAIPALGTGVSTIGAPTIVIDAPYVAIVGPIPNSSLPNLAPVDAAGDASLNINASFIDLVNQFQLNNIGQATFTSSGDIRLTSTNGIAASNTNALTPGELFTAGDLTFKAADVYPSTGSTFILDAVAPNDASGNPIPTTISFLANGTSDVPLSPLSAGGTLLVDATNIVQAGTVRAPFGSLIFGIGDATDPGTIAQFNNLPLLVNTQSVTLTGGSVTSVSADGAVIPYGDTVDGVEWQFNPVPGLNAAPDLTAPPSKFISVNGSNVALNAGANIDLSGGGDLQAEEWVAGTGGSRDVLSQYNLSYASNPAGVAAPTLPGGANIYAILPGPQSPVAAYDPIFAQTLQPAVNGDGSVGTATQQIGVGKAALDGAVGESVYLSGVAGLPAGYYTLLPAKYATLPGAYRVTVQGSGDNIAPGTHVVSPDGTQVVSGYFGNALDGSHGSTEVLFDVQSGAVWQQYSQYTLTSANTFFPNLAANAGNVTPQLPMDGGQLVIAAINQLSLGAVLNTASATGGAPAEVDIASQDIQIVGNGEAALSGYLQISADQLNQLGAGSLLIGGTRSQIDSGMAIDAVANSVVVSNDAANPLTGPEIILVTKAGDPSADANAVNGLRIDTGSVIAAQGDYPAAKDVPISIGDANVAGSGDGALLRVSNGGDAVVTRIGTTPANNPGLLTVGAGASLVGGQSLTLDSSGNLTFDPAALLSGNTIAVDGFAITFTDKTGADAASLPGFVMGAVQIAQLADAQEVILRSSDAMNFDGNTDIHFGNAVDLSAGVFSSNGGAVTISAPEIAFTNDAGAAVPDNPASGAGTLTVNANEIDFGAGNKTIAGFGSATFNASGGIVGQGTGTFDFASLPVTMNAPVYLADTSSDATIKTTGVMNLNSMAGTALTLTPVGGALSFIGGTINDNGATIEAPAGNVSLDATSGDLNIASDALISSAGVSKQFFDTVVFAPAGSISLSSDIGTVNVQAGSTLDFSGSGGGGAAGSLSLSAPAQTVQLAGTIKGNAADGYLGGSFNLNTGGAVDLDSLSMELASSGVNDGMTIQTGAGNLLLSAGNTITAHMVSLTADGGAGGQDPNNGNVDILGTIDASGNAGGEIDLYGKSGVDLEGSLIATGSSPTERGGNVNIGTTAINTPNVNSTYGYEDIAAADAGTITLGGSATIDVSGGTAGGLSNGTVNFRLPIVNDGSGGATVNLVIEPRTAGAGPLVSGARSVNLEAYGIWSTTDNSTGDQHFDGIVDPAGWYGDSVAGAGEPGMVAGTWTDQSGAPLANPNTPEQLADYLSNDFFTPSAGMANTDHQGFYGYKNGDATEGPGTLMNFVENGVQEVANNFANTGIANFAVAPGIELDNPSVAINNGDISILTNWNLGSGASQSALDFRFNGQAPVITFKAENNVKVNASLTDGFFQIANPVGSGVSVDLPAPTDYTHAEASWDTTAYGQFSSYIPVNYSYLGLSGPHNWALTSDPVESSEIAQYYGFYTDYVHYLFGTNDAITHNPNFIFYAGQDTSNLPMQPSQPQLSVSVPDAADEDAHPDLYLRYFAAYRTYLSQISAWESMNSGVTPHIDILQPPPITLAPVLSGGPIVITPPALDNSPSPVAVAGNTLPLISASLAGGDSSSFRLVAGANMQSANPLALQAASVFSATSGGNVTLDGHFAYVDSNNQSLLAPTMIRTGSGAIDIAAGNDIALLDTTAPGVIYTAGVPVAGGGTATIVNGSASQGLPDILVTPAVSPDSAGDISIRAQNDITGVENPNSQFWWQWMQIGANPTVVFNQQLGIGINQQITQTSIDFGALDQGVMSVGGNVSVSAGGNISDLAVSLPTTWYSTNGNTTLNTVGGGNLTVTAGGNIMSGDYFVAKGTGTITAGGLIGADFAIPPNFSGASPTPVSTLFATQDGTLNISARQGVDVGGVFDPSYVEGNNLLNIYHQHADFQSYSPDSAVNVSATTGDVDFGTLGDVSLIGGGAVGSNGTQGQQDYSSILPATVNLTAFTGGIHIDSGASLFPSATGNLNLIADQSITFSAQNGIRNFGMLDVDPSLMPSAPTPDASIPSLTDISSIAHDQSPLHADDTIPARIYSLDGSIVDGILEPAGSGGVAGFYDKLMNVMLDKSALIQAGQDIVNLAFQGQNLRDADITRIVAGRDIDDTPLAPGISPAVPGLVLAGPGTFDIEAGRNIGPLTNEQEIFDAQGNGTVSGTPGIQAIGNAANPNLPHESAAINVLFGIGPGVNDAGFIAGYIDPSSTVAGVPSSTPALIAFMENYDAGQGIDTGLAADKTAAQAAVGTLSADQAWAQFQVLPSYVQQLFSEQVLFGVLTDVGHDFHDASSPFFNQYSRGYQAINTLFPASFGYTANDLTGGLNGANKLLATGNLDIRSTTIQTQQGGNVTILGPGGQALVGSTSAPPEIIGSNGLVAVGPGTQGILTLEQGDINIFTDTSLLLAQSRIFTEQGGDMTIWSSNGDINAGKGAKSSADIPPPIYVCDDNHYCTVDARGEVTGAGIATLQTIPDAPPGDVNLLAPRGTVDAGDAGIRVSGNINIDALAVANAANIQVQGKSTGIPVLAQVNVGALTNASAAASQAAIAAENVVHQQQAAARQALPSIFTVTVLGFGNDPAAGDKSVQPGAKSSDVQSSVNVSYNATSPLQFVGVNGDLDPKQVARLNDNERRQLPTQGR